MSGNKITDSVYKSIKLQLGQETEGWVSAIFGIKEKENTVLTLDLHISKFSCQHLLIESPDPFFSMHCCHLACILCHYCFWY